MTINLALIPKADILIVDDTPNNLRLLGQILGKEYKIRLAPSGQIALTAAQSAPPDLILLDVMMPGMNGYEVADRLKAGEQTKEIPIIFISALDDTDSKVRAFAVGGVDYVTKPFQEREVLARVETHLTLRNLYKQAQAEIVERKQVEEKLRQSEERFRLMVNSTEDMVFTLDCDQRHTGVYGPWVEKNGLTAKFFLGRTSYDVFGATAVIHEDANRRALDGEPVLYEWSTPGKDGLQYYQTSLSPLRDAAGEIIGLVGIGREITERRKVEKALQESQELFSLFMRYSPVYTFIKTVTPTESRVVLASENYQDMIGIPGSKMVGMTMDELFPAEHAAKFTADDWSVVSNGQVLKLDEDLNGRNYTTIKFPIVQGEKTLLAGYTIDITERKQAEAALSHRNREMAMLYETSLEINALSDVSALLHAIVQRACGLLNIRAGALYLVQPDEEMLELVVQHQLPPHWVGVKIRLGEGLAGQVVQTKKPMAVEDYLTWGGRLEAFRDSPARRVLGVPLQLHDQITGVIVLVDEQVGVFSEDEIRLASLFADQAAIAVSNAQFAAQLEERVAQRTSELEAANRELESLSYNIAHDMRSPVRAMVGFAGILEQSHRTQLDSEGLQMLANIHTSGLRLGQMIDSFLAFLHLGHVTAHIQKVNMNRILNQLVKNLEPEQEKRKIEFNIGNLPECQGDPKLLEQVWAELISNALKFTRHREVARIEIGSGEADGKPYYFVRDNGVGFDMKYSAKLFGVFQRLHHESEFEGTGIGLAIIKRIVQRHGGKVWVEADVDKGAVFYFMLTD